MKKLFLPLSLLLVAGCGPKEDATATAPPAPAATPAKAAATPVKAPAKAAEAVEEAPKAAAGDCPAPSKLAPKKGATYVVKGEAQPGMPGPMLKALAAVKMAPPPTSFKVPNDAKVELQTSKGNITVQLDTAGAPLHAKSFYYLASKGFFNGTTFHRWANLMEGSPTPGYIIQGGDPLTKNPATRAYAGGGGPGYTIPREHNGVAHNALVLAAARTSDPDSAGSQFYITQNPVCFLDQGDGYTVFGRVVVGKDVALKLVQDDVIKKAIVK